MNVKAARRHTARAIHRFIESLSIFAEVVGARRATFNASYPLPDSGEEIPSCTHRGLMSGTST